MGIFSKQSKEELEAKAAEMKKAEAERIISEGMATIRDIIAPAAIQVEFNYLRLGNYFLRTLFVYNYPRYLYTDWLSPIINSEFAIDTAIFIYPVQSKEVLGQLRNKSAQIEATYAESQMKGQVRDPMLETAYQDVEQLRDTLQRGEAKFFKSSLYFTIYAKTLEELDSQTSFIENLLGGKIVLTKSALLQQEQGLNSTLPFCHDEILITKNLDTGALSTFFPFVSNDLSRNEGILYGINRHNNSLVIFDRFKLENANSVVFAKSGSGKSYAVKLEALRYLLFGTDLIVIDPEKEYERLCGALGGAYLDINVNSTSRINPFDLPQIAPDSPEQGENHLRSNIIMLQGLLRVMMGGDVSPTESNLLDQALAQTYASKGITQDPKTHNLPAPTMGDLEKTLSSIKGAEGLAQKIKKYTTGSFSGLFNEPTNINMTNRFIVFSIRDLEDELRPIAMYMILNFIWNRVKGEVKKRLLIIEEAWLLMKYEDSAQFLYSMAKRARKYYLGLTTISQEIEDFLGSQYGRAIVNNSSMSILLKQHPATVDLVAQVFKLTQAEKYFLLNSAVGECLFFAGQNHIAVQITPSYQEDLLITTNPEQLKQLEG